LVTTGITEATSHSTTQAKTTAATVAATSATTLATTEATETKTTGGATTVVVRTSKEAASGETTGTTAVTNQTDTGTGKGSAATTSNVTEPDGHVACLEGCLVAAPDLRHPSNTDSPDPTTPAWLWPLCSSAVVGALAVAAGYGVYKWRRRRRGARARASSMPPNEAGLELCHSAPPRATAPLVSKTDNVATRQASEDSETKEQVLKTKPKPRLAPEPGIARLEEPAGSGISSLDVGSLCAGG